VHLLVRKTLILSKCTVLQQQKTLWYNKHLMSCKVTVFGCGSQNYVIKSLVICLYLQWRNITTNEVSNLGMGRTQIENMHAAVESVYSFHACLECNLLAVLVQLLICHADWETQIDTVREILLRRMLCKKDKIMKQLSTSLAQIHVLTRCYCCCRHIVVCVCGLYNNVSVAVTA
jgi:hypothetical protein